MSGGVWRKCSSSPISTGKTDNQSIIGISTILNALFGVVFILLYQSVLNFWVVPVCHPGFVSAKFISI